MCIQDVKNELHPIDVINAIIVKVFDQHKLRCVVSCRDFCYKWEFGFYGKIL